MSNKLPKWICSQSIQANAKVCENQKVKGNMMLNVAQKYNTMEKTDATKDSL